MSGNEIRELTCAKCGALLEPLPDHLDVACVCCGHQHASIPPPPAAEEKPTFNVGDGVAVKWGERWWPARVLGTMGPELYRVQFDGWGPAMQEVVAGASVRRKTEVDLAHSRPSDTFEIRQKISHVSLPLKLLLGTALGLLLFFIGYFGVYVAFGPPGDSNRASGDPSMAAIGGKARETRPLGPNERLSEGQVVEVLWGDTWYTGKVIDQIDDGQIAVHYEGWSEKYDEVVPRELIRIPE